VSDEHGEASLVTTWRGVVEHLHRAPVGGGAMEPLAQAVLVAGAGIEGDRYDRRTGTYSDRHHIDRQVTLVEAEVLEALLRDHGVVLEPHEHRRNVTVRGVPLGHLVGRYFSIGACVLFGGRLNVPCRYLESTVGKPVFRPLIHRSGLNARIVVGGTVAVGDLVTPVDPVLLDPALRAANDAERSDPPPEVF